MGLESLPLLSVLIWLPILTGAALFLVGGDGRPVLIKWIALMQSLISLGLSVWLWGHFDVSQTGMQFVETLNWLPQLNIQYALGVDGFAVPLILLNALLMPVIVLASWSSVKERLALYLAAFMVLQGMVVGVFAALDAILFYLFFEALLIPMFLIIGIWGGPNRIYATLKFFLYTFLGSVLFLVALIYCHLQAQALSLEMPFAIQSFYQLSLPLATQQWLFFAFFVAFAVKIPMWPVHTWLPDAHVEAPTAGSVILAAILLKLGGYGFIRFLLPILPDASKQFAPIVIALSLIAVVYIGFVAIIQSDMKKLIAYSSVAHMGFVSLGCFVPLLMAVQKGAGEVALSGAYVQMISHGFVSGAMFLCIGVLYDRMHSRLINDYGGVVNVMPKFAFFFVLFAMANAGLPGTAGFVGEFMVILGTFKANIGYAFLAAMTLILGAAYTLWMVKRVLYGPVNSDQVAALNDISLREALLLGFLAFWVILLGIYPAPLFDMTQGSVSELLSLMTLGGAQ